MIKLLFSEEAFLHWYASEAIGRLMLAVAIIVSVVVFVNFVTLARVFAVFFAPRRKNGSLLGRKVLAALLDLPLELLCVVGGEFVTTNPEWNPPTRLTIIAVDARMKPL